MDIIEIKKNRKIYGGSDGHAINRHSTRLYKTANGIYFEIDKNLDALLPFYTLFMREDIVKKVYVNKIVSYESKSSEDKPHIPKTIKIDNDRYWGDGLSWKKAEKIAFEVIKNLIN